MTLSIREQILQAFKTRLEAATYDNLDGPVTVYRNRMRPPDTTECPLLLMYDGGEQGETDITSHRRVVMMVEVTGYVATTEASIGADMSDLMAGVFRAILSDRTLGGTASDVREGEVHVETMGDDAAHPILAFSTEFEVEYWVNPENPYASAP